MVLPAGPGGLPPVGAQAVLLGVAQFNSAVQNVTQGFQQINTASVRMSESTRVSFDNSTRVYNRFTENVRQGSNASRGAITALAVAAGQAMYTIASSVLNAASSVATAGATFQQAVKPVQVFGEATDAQMRQLADTTLDLSRNFNVGANNIAAAESALVKAGLSFKQVNDEATKAAVALNVASDGELTLARGSELIAQAMFAFKGQIQGANEAAAVLIGTAQNSTATFTDLYLAFKQTVPLAAAMKIPFSELGATIALLNNEGIRGETAGTSLRNAFLRLIKPTKDVTDLMIRYNISLFNTKGEFIGLRPVVQQLNSVFGDQAIATGKITEAQRDQALASLGMSRSLLAVLTIAQQGTGEFDRLNAAIKRTDPNSILDQFSNTLIGQLGIMLNNIKAIAIAWSSDFTTSATQAIKNVNEQLRQINLNDVRAAARQISADFIKALEEIPAAWDRITAGGSALWNDLVTGAQAAATDVSTVIIGTINDVIDAAQTVVDGIATTINGIVGAVGKVVTTIAENIISVFQPSIDILGQELPNAAGSTRNALITIAAVAITTGKVVSNAVDYIVTALMPAARQVATETSDSIMVIVRETTDSLLVIARGAQRLLTGIVTAITQNAVTQSHLLSSVIDFIEQRIADLFKFLSGLPVVGGFFQGVIDQFTNTKQAITSFVDSVQQTIASIPDGIDQVIQSIQDTFDSTLQSVTGFIDIAKQSVAAFSDDTSKAFQTTITNIQAAIPAFQNWISKLKTIVSGTKEVEDAHDRLARAQANNAKRAINPAGEQVNGEDLAFPVDRAKEFQNYVKSLLKDIPGITDEFAKFIAELAQADPNRLMPMVNVLKSQSGLIREILDAKRQLLATEIRIEETNRRIEAITLQQQRLDLLARQATIPMESQLLNLRQQSLQVEAQMLPIQNAMAAIDRQIALLQQENLGLTRQRLLLEQQALPIQNRIADLDKQIADTQRENYALTAQRLQLEQQMLPITQAIEALQQQLQQIGRTNYDVERQRLQLELSRLPLEQQINAIETQIADAQRTNFDLVDSRLRTEQQMLPVKARITAADRAIADVQRTNYSLAKQRAQAELDALPIKQRMADLEQQITDSVDKQAALTAQRNQLVAERGVTTLERQLDDVNKQLDDLWARFSIRPTGPAAAGLVPQIVGLEAEKTRLENLLKPAQDALTTIQRQQEDVNYQNELTRIGLEQQVLAQEALLAPINARVRALQAEQAAAEARNAVTLIGLQQQKQDLEDLLIPYQDLLDQLDRQQNEQRILTDLTVNGLNKQKQLLQDLERPYDEQLNRLAETQQNTDLLNRIQETYIQEEIQRLQDLLIPMQARLTAIVNEQNALNLRNEIARNGLEAEKQKWVDLLRPIQDALDAVERQRQAEDARKAIAINGLEQQKLALQNLLTPLEDVKRRIDEQTTAITNQRDQVLNAYERQKLALEALKLTDELYKNQLEQTRNAEQQRLSDLIQRFQDALIKSGQFTTQEAVDAVTRLSLWGSERDKLSDLRTEYDRLNTALGNSGGTWASVSGSVNTLNALLPSTNTGFNNLALAVTPAGQNLGSFKNTIDPLVATALPGLSFYLADNKRWFGDLGGSVSSTRIELENFYARAYDLAGDGNRMLPTLSNWLSYTRDRINELRNSIVDAKDRMTDWRGVIGYPTIGGTLCYDLAQLGLMVSAVKSTIGTRYDANSLAQNVSEATSRFYEWKDAINSAANALRTFPTGTVNVWKSFDKGGIVPGQLNAPMFAIVHGGERVIPTSAGISSEPTAVSTGSVMNQYNTVVNNNYNFSAAYERQQDPITLGQDLRAVLELTRR